MCCYTKNILLNYREWQILKDSNYQLYEERCKNTVDATYSKYQDWWEQTIQVMFNLKNLSAIGIQSIDSAKKRTSCDSYKEDRFSILYNAFSSNPAIYDTLSLSIGYNVLLFSEAIFASQNTTPSSEVTLTERYLHTISVLGSMVESYYNDIAKFDDDTSHKRDHFSISKIDFQTKNREKHIGGDFALVIESRDCNGFLKITPIIFQAKVSKDCGADISYRNNKTNESQFDTLCKQKNSYYIFYPSSDDMEKNTLPSVKSVKHIDPRARTTSTVHDVVTLSTLYLDIISNTINNYRSFDNRIDMLNSIYSRLEEGDINHLVVISNDESARSAYQKFEASLRNISQINSSKLNQQR